MSLKRRLLKCRLTEAKFPTLQKKTKCRTCDREVSKIRHDGRRIFGRNVVVISNPRRMTGCMENFMLYVMKLSTQRNYFMNSLSEGQSDILERRIPTPKFILVYPLFRSRQTC